MVQKFHPTYCFCPVNGDVGAVDVGRRLVLQVLQARIARLLGETSLIAEVEESTNAIFTGLKVEVLNKPEAVKFESAIRTEGLVGRLPFAETRVQVHDGLAAVDSTKTSGIGVQHLVCGLGQEAANVNIRDSLAVLEAFRKGQLRWIGPHGGDSTWNSRLLLGESFHILNDVSICGFHHLVWQSERPELRDHAAIGVSRK